MARPVHGELDRVENLRQLLGFVDDQPVRAGSEGLRIEPRLLPDRIIIKGEVGEFRKFLVEERAFPHLAGAGQDGDRKLAMILRSLGVSRLLIVFISCGEIFSFTMRNIPREPGKVNLSRAPRGRWLWVSRDGEGRIGAEELGRLHQPLAPVGAACLRPLTMK